MTDIEKAWFMQGYIYQLAQEAKENGLFNDLSIKEIMDIYIEEFNK